MRERNLMSSQQGAFIAVFGLASLALALVEEEPAGPRVKFIELG